MRPINRISHRLRSLARRPRPTRTQLWLRRAGIALAVLSLWMGASYWLWSSGRIAAATATVERGFSRLARASGLEVEAIFVQGRVLTNERELQRVLESWLHRSILEVDLDATKSKLERLPWVKSAAVRREFPGTLLAQIVEHRPLAIWQERTTSRPQLIDDAGAVVTVADLRPYRDLRQVSGPEAPPRAKELFDLLDEEPDLARRVTVASFIGKRRWDLLLDGRVVVRLPEQDIRTAWQRLARHERESRLLERTIEAVDLRHKDWLVLRTMEVPGPTAARGGRGA